MCRSSVLTVYMAAEADMGIARIPLPAREHLLGRLAS